MCRSVVIIWYFVTKLLCAVLVKDTEQRMNIVLSKSGLKIIAAEFSGLTGSSVKDTEVKYLS